MNNNEIAGSIKFCFRRPCTAAVQMTSKAAHTGTEQNACFQNLPIILMASNSCPGELLDGI